MAKAPSKSGGGSKKSGHSPRVESLAGKTLQNDKAGKTAKTLAAAVLSHADGKPNKPKGK